jgi:hypothetical protein
MSTPTNPIHSSYSWTSSRSTVISGGSTVISSGNVVNLATPDIKKRTPGGGNEPDSGFQQVSIRMVAQKCLSSVALGCLSEVKMKSLSQDAQGEERSVISQVSEIVAISIHHASNGSEFLSKLKEYLKEKKSHLEAGDFHTKLLWVLSLVEEDIPTQSGCDRAGGHVVRASLLLAKNAWALANETLKPGLESIVRENADCLLKELRARALPVNHTAPALRAVSPHPVTSTTSFLGATAATSATTFTTTAVNSGLRFALPIVGPNLSVPASPRPNASDAPTITTTTSTAVTTTTTSISAPLAVSSGPVPNSHSPKTLGAGFNADKCITMDGSLRKTLNFIFPAIDNRKVSDTTAQFLRLVYFIENETFTKAGTAILVHKIENYISEELGAHGKKFEKFLSEHYESGSRLNFSEPQELSAVSLLKVLREAPIWKNKPTTDAWRTDLADALTKVDTALWPAEYAEIDATSSFSSTSVSNVGVEKKEKKQRKEKKDKKVKKEKEQTDAQAEGGNSSNGNSTLRKRLSMMFTAPTAAKHYALEPAAEDGSDS